jgi:hypothetical protein
MALEVSLKSVPSDTTWYHLEAASPEKRLELSMSEEPNTSH